LFSPSLTLKNPTSLRQKRVAAGIPFSKSSRRDERNIMQQPPHSNPEAPSGQSQLPAERIHRAIVALRSAAEHFTEAAVLTDKSHTHRLMRLVAKVDAAIAPLHRIERELDEISRGPA
jgi:hypothetical protein